MSDEASPQAVIVAGPNGAGKSTLAPRLLAQELDITIYVNADVIAQGLAGFDPASAAIRAGRIMLERVEELRRERVTFAVESTISGRSLLRVIESLKSSGYDTLLVYLWLPEPDVAVERVGNRVRLGGHHVPETDIRRRYSRSISNFETVYRRTTHEWRVYAALRPVDEVDLRLIARGAGNEEFTIVDGDAWTRIKRQAGGKHEAMPERVASCNDDAVYERALENAFQDAVRQHRIYNLPIAMRKGKEIVRVSPFEIHLPEDDDPATPKRVTNGTR